LLNKRDNRYSVPTGTLIVIVRKKTDGTSFENTFVWCSSVG